MNIIIEYNFQYPHKKYKKYETYKIL